MSILLQVAIGIAIPYVLAAFCALIAILRGRGRPEPDRAQAEELLREMADNNLSGWL